MSFRQTLHGSLAPSCRQWRHQNTRAPRARGPCCRRWQCSGRSQGPTQSCWRRSTSSLSPDVYLIGYTSLLWLPTAVSMISFTIFCSAKTNITNYDNEWSQLIQQYVSLYSMLLTFTWDVLLIWWVYWDLIYRWTTDEHSNSIIHYSHQ